MTLAEIIAIFREEADDKLTPRLWSDTLLTAYANEAQLEACRRARLLEDAETPTVCEYQIRAGDRYIEPDKRAIFVRSLRIGSTQWTIPKISIADLELSMPEWQTSSPAIPVVYCTNYTRGKIYFAPSFANADAVYLRVVREPLKDMTIGTETTPGVDPEIPRRYQFGLINWMLFRAYSKQNSETVDPDKAALALALFEREFGPKSAAIDEQWIATHHGYDHADGIF